MKKMTIKSIIALGIIIIACTSYAAKDNNDEKGLIFGEAVIGWMDLMKRDEAGEIITKEEVLQLVGPLLNPPDDDNSYAVTSKIVREYLKDNAPWKAKVDKQKADMLTEQFTSSFTNLTTYDTQMGPIIGEDLQDLARKGGFEKELMSNSAEMASKTMINRLGNITNKEEIKIILENIKTYDIKVPDEVVKNLEAKLK